MRTRRFTRFFFAAGALAMAAALALLSGCAGSRPEPLELKDARVAIQDAQSAGADHFSPDLYQASQSHLAAAETNWTTRHDPDAAAHYARLAESEARDAEARARMKKSELDVEAGRKRRAELEIAVRDAEIRALASKAQSEAERARLETEARHRREQEAEERMTALQAQIDAERQKRADEQHQAEIDRLKSQLEEERKTAESARRAAEEQVAAAQRTAEEEKRRAQEREHAQSEFLARLSALTTTRVETRGIVLTLPGSVYFDSSRSDVKPGMRQRLEEIGQALASLPDRHLLVEGHTDSTGTAAFNLRLSELRAESVKAILVAAGVSPDRIEVHGYGPTKPVASNGTASGRSQNRRVEIVVQGG